MRSGRLVLVCWLALLSWSLGDQAAGAPREAYVHSRVLEQVQEAGEAGVIVVMGASDLPQAMARDWRERGWANAELARRVMRAAPRFRVTHQYEVFPFLAGRADERGLRELMVCSFVEGVYPDRELRAVLDDSGPLIGQPTAEAANHDGEGVGVAILDSGIDYTHPDLGGSADATAFPNTKVVAGYDFVNSDDYPMDDEGHGTYVAGIAAGSGSTYRGIAPAASLVALKVLDENGVGYSSYVISAIQWCIQRRTDYNIKVINLSLSDTGEWTDPSECDGNPEGQAISDAADNGMVVAAAAGNEGHLGGVGIPACASDAVAVGATYDAAYSYVSYPGLCQDQNVSQDDICCFSNRGELLELFAPGALITSARWSGSPYGSGLYEVGGGTSAAAPHVAGGAAVLFDMLGASATPDDVRSLLRRTGVQIVDPLTGVATPRIDLAQAVSGIPISGPDLVVTQVTSDTSSALVGAPVGVSVTVRNQGDVASGACTAVVVLTRSQVASPQDDSVATVAVPALGAGANWPSGTVSGAIPGVTPGSYHVGAYVDSSYVVAERDETNNGFVGPGITVEGLSSWMVSNTIPASMLKGQTYTISMTILNEGTSAWAAADGYALRAVSPPGTARWGISTVPLPGGQTVYPNQSVRFQFNVTAPSAPGLYPCHWQMARGSVQFGEVVTGATKTRVVDDATYGQQFPSISGEWVAYMDYGGLYRDYFIPAISATYLPTLQTITLPEDIPFPRDPQGAPYPPYQYFDVSNHLLPDISGTWVTWVVDDKLRTGDDPMDPNARWYYQVTAYNVQQAGQLPRRIVSGEWDAINPAIDGNYVVWEDYRNDPDRLWNPRDFLADDADIYIYDIAANVAKPLCTAPGPQLSPRISGNLVVWEDWRNFMASLSDLYMYDLGVDTDGDGTPNWKDSDRPNPDPAETRLTATYWSEQYPDISGQSLVWLDLRRDTGAGMSVDIYLRDVAGVTETAVATDPATLRIQPRVDGTKVTWTDFRQGQADLYWMQARTGVGAAIAASGVGDEFSNISGDRVAHEKLRRTLMRTHPTTQELIRWDVYNVWVQKMLRDGSVGVHTFPDVPSTHWAWDYVEAIVANGVAGGYPNGTYQPAWVVGRDQMAAYLARSLEGGGEFFDTYEPTGQTFSDVDPGYWAYKYIEYCAHPDQDIVNGFPDGTYQPTWQVSRGAMAAFIGGAMAGGQSFFDTYVPPATPSFPDVTQSGDWGWAYAHVEYIREQGVTAGYPDGKYHPEYLCGRDQMAVYVSRAFGYLD